MSSTPNRSNLIGWSQPFGAFSPATNDALRPHCLRPTSKYVRNFKGMDHRSLAVASPAIQNNSDLSQGHSLRLTAQSTRNGGISLATQGARHERHDLEGGPGEAGLDAVFGHRMGGGLCNRDYPACASVGKRSGVRPAGSSREC